jgi:hypothetical protein
LFVHTPVQIKNSNLEENMSSSFVRKINVVVSSLFSFVATLQEESHGQGIYISLVCFALIPKYIDKLDEVK